MPADNIRLSDADRARAMEALGTYFAEGRLTVTEFEERSGKAATATTAGELTPLFDDLPGGMPTATPIASASTELATLKRKRDISRAVESSAGIVAFGLFLVLQFVFNLNYAWVPFLLIPMAVGGSRKFLGLSEEEEKLLKVLERKQVQEQAKRLEGS
ncbi:DUF1707 SHOCT-like domain-containing protein [Corynebacterium epidermidicanis]|uniref:Putative DUF1707 family protein n=1 Tax=Corynebacterium epidermidicanis TaxID=1050174 RepID=A0A0G3GQ15_9CORY|nr:DUF1707 domain-containing protein [Corynebacterium epidermidicanis]AKK02640.1 putative DUF1707 family protein [Corynebacterium epidermidicanis]